MNVLRLGVLIFVGVAEVFGDEGCISVLRIFLEIVCSFCGGVSVMIVEVTGDSRCIEIPALEVVGLLGL